MTFKLSLPKERKKNKRGEKEKKKGMFYELWLNIKAWRGMAQLSYLHILSSLSSQLFLCAYIPICLSHTTCFYVNNHKTFISKRKNISLSTNSYLPVTIKFFTNWKLKGREETFAIF